MVCTIVFFLMGFAILIMPLTIADGSSTTSLGQSLSPQGPPPCRCPVTGRPRNVISEKKQAPPCRCEPDEIDPPSDYHWVSPGFRGLARIKSVESARMERVTYKCDALVSGFGGRFFRTICVQHQWQLHYIGGVGFCKKCMGEPNNTCRIITIDVALQDDDVGVCTYLTICQVEALLRMTTSKLFALVDCGYDMDALLRDGLLGLKANFTSLVPSELHISDFIVYKNMPMADASIILLSLHVQRRFQGFLSLVFVHYTFSLSVKLCWHWWGWILFLTQIRSRSPIIRRFS